MSFEVSPNRYLRYGSAGPGYVGLFAYLENKNKVANFFEKFLYFEGWGKGKYKIMRRKAEHEKMGHIFYARIKDVSNARKSIINVLKIIVLVNPIFLIIAVIYRYSSRYDLKEINPYKYDGNRSPGVFLLDGDEINFDNSLRKTQDLDNLPFNNIPNLNNSDPFVDKLKYVVMNGRNGDQSLSVESLANYCDEYRAFAPELLEKIVKEVSKEVEDNSKAEIIIKFLQSERSYYTIPKKTTENFIAKLNKYIQENIKSEDKQ